MSKKFMGKFLSTVLAAACAVNIPLISSAAGEKETRYEFEDGTYTSDCVFDNTIEGFSGTGYIDSQEGDVSVTINVETEGLYNLIIGYCLPEDRSPKEQSLYVNGTQMGNYGFGISNEFTELTIKSIKLKAGENTIEFRKNWGWVLYDYLAVEPTVNPTLTASKKLSDPDATIETKRLMSYLADNYGKHVISGQQELYGQANENEFEYIYNLSGEYPAIRGFDYMNWSQGVAWDDGTNKRIIDWVKDKNGIATIAWHWFVPLDMETYVEGSLPNYSGVSFYNKKGDSQKYTNFSPAKAVQEGTAENKFINTDIEMIAKALQELQDQNIPVIFRPLHEAEGASSLNGEYSWFWWGNDGAEAYKELWKYLYNKLTNEYGLHNLIWEWNSYTYDTSAAWYPGDEYVDLIAYDKYNANGSPNESAITDTFYNLVEKYDGKKMVAMAENDTIPSLENLTSEKAAWLYFCVWYDSNPQFLTGSNYQNADTVKEIYQSEYCITRSELPEDLYTAYPIDETPVEPTDPTEEPTTEPSEPTDPTEEPTTEPSEPTEPTEEPTTEPSEPTDSTEEPTTEPSEPTEPTEPSSGITVPDGAKATLYGDVDCNGLLEVNDIVVLNMFLLDQTTVDISDTGKANADVERDGYLDLSDSSKIINYLAELITSEELGK